jgi:hypothetical protein
MPAADYPLAIVELERQILRVLCSECADGWNREDSSNRETRATAVSGLRSYCWHDTEHCVVFEALARLPGRDAVELRRQLPAQATRMGFPDVRWEIYFACGTAHAAQASNARRPDLNTLIAQLLAASAESSP